MYTGVLWSPSTTTFMFVDELGNFAIFSALSEKIKESAVIIAPNSRQQKSILNSHKNPMLSMVVGYKESLIYLSLIPERGQILLWQTCMDDKCIEYFGHTDAIVNVAVLPQFEYSTSVPTSNSKSNSTKQLPPNANAQMNETLALLVANTQPIPPPSTMGNNVPASSRSNSLSNSQNALINAKSDLILPTKTAISICKEENLFFSCSADGVLRCWDEFLKTEQYQFRCSSHDNPAKSTKTKNFYKETSNHTEVTYMLMLWDFNTVVTGSEDGSVCLWNADLGSKLMSNVLTHAISSIVYGKSKKW